MGEMMVWVSRKDNPHMTDDEIAARNAELDALVNNATQVEIDARWGKEQGPPFPKVTP